MNRLIDQRGTPKTQLTFDVLIGCGNTHATSYTAQERFDKKPTHSLSFKVLSTSNGVKQYNSCYIGGKTQLQTTPALWTTSPHAPTIGGS
uniref:Uncharacterized protein n=1 Tax=Arundo donax TaxID=35708 RepID=A0A0A9B4V4_ARUDO